MIDFLNSFKSLVKVEKIYTDNNVFKLHYKVTVIMLIVFSILLTSKQYFGDPIECDVENKRELYNTFCWIYGSYTLPVRDGEKVLRGLGLDVNTYFDQRNENHISTRTYHRYYQWVCIIFCFQALVFYMPRYLWKIWEGGRLRHLIKDLTGPVITPLWTNMAKDKLVTYLIGGKYAHNAYALRYCVCELLNFLNVLGQIYFLNWFLMGQFFMYGINVLQNKQNNMSVIFPTLAKCTYYKYGPSGSMQNHDALCVLPLNILNEKLFLILWFWLYILLAISAVAVLYRLLFMIVPAVRVYMHMGQVRSIGKKKATMIVKSLSFGDFFVMYNIGKNVNPMVYKELVNGVYDQVRTKETFSLSNTVCIEEVK
ncbi:unnamed protein product [Brassicogethes aeneus]|uniref:Innexin n=1 Tax=Brassicogethes aeneus TaxID=1431903 RepID=A0A9P0BH94_BRAAE|nr:unnamed protein product [Brassicogethes aeneus]